MQLQTAMRQRAAHQRFEQLAKSEIVKQERDRTIRQAWTPVDDASKQQFQYIKLPDGNYGKFLADANDAEIIAAIEKDFPQAKPWSIYQSLVSGSADLTSFRHAALNRASSNPVIPNEKSLPRAPCTRQTPRPVPLHPPGGPTTRRRSRFPGVGLPHRLAAALALPREALVAMIQRARRVPRRRSLGTE